MFAALQGHLPIVQLLMEQWVALNKMNEVRADTGDYMLYCW